jgi:hypothetical protein
VVRREEVQSMSSFSPVPNYLHVSIIMQLPRRVSLL